MTGLLQALEPKRKVPCGQIPLSTRLQGLLERNLARVELPSAPTKTPLPRTVETATRLPVTEAAKAKLEKAG